MRGEFIYYALLIITGLSINTATYGYSKRNNLFNRAKIKETSILRRIPIVRKLVEKEPYYARVIPMLITIAVFLIVLVIYICFWIYPPSVASFLASPWTIGLSVLYMLVIAVYDMTI